MRSGQRIGAVLTDASHWTRAVRPRIGESRPCSFPRHSPLMAFRPTALDYIAWCIRAHVAVGFSHAAGCRGAWLPGSAGQQAEVQRPLIVLQARPLWCQRRRFRKGKKRLSNPLPTFRSTPDLVVGMPVLRANLCFARLTPSARFQEKDRPGIPVLDRLLFLAMLVLLV